MAEDIHIVGMDASQLEAALRQISQRLAEYSGSLLRVTGLQAQVSASGQVLSATIQGLTTTGARLSAGFKELGGSLLISSLGFNQMGAAATSAGISAQTALQRIITSWATFTRFVQFRIVYASLYALIGALRAAITASKDFQIHISEIRTISQENQLSFQQWSDSIRRLSDQFAKPIADVAKATYETLSNQIAEGADATNFLASALKFARLTNSTTEESVNLLSSAIKSFGLQVQDTERIAAVFFKVIDLGRVRAGEMANTFGRIGPLASAVGVSFEETGAAIATLTIKGVKYNEAFTQISNLLTALIKPTKGMKELFKQWGVENGETAVKTFGFVEVLRKIETASRGNSSELAKLFPNIRGLRGAITLATSSLVDYEDALDKITRKSAEQAKAGFGIATESAGYHLEQELIKVKNFLIYDFGGPFIETILKVGKVLGGDGGLAGTIKRIGIGLSTLFKIYIGFKIAATLSAVSGGLTVLIHRFLDLRATGGLTFASMSAGLKSMVTGAALAKAAIIGIVLAWERQNELDRQAASARQDALDQLTELHKAQRELIDETAAKETQAILKSLKDQFQLRLQHVAASRKIIEAFLADQKKLVEDQKNVIKLAFGVQTTILEQNLNKLNDAYRTTLGNIKEATALINDLRDRQQDKGFEIDLEFAKPEDKIKLIIERIKTLRLEFSTLLKATGDPTVDEQNLKRSKERALEIGNLLKTLAREKNTIEEKRLELTNKIAELEAKNATDRKVDVAKEGFAQQRLEEAKLKAQETALARRSGSRAIEDLRRRRQVLEASRREGTAELGTTRNAEAAAEDAKEIADAKAKVNLLTLQSKILPDLASMKSELANIDEEMTRKLGLFIKAQEKSAALKKQDIDLQKKQVDALKQSFKEILEFKLPSVKTDTDKTQALGSFDALLKQAEKTGGLQDQQTILELQKYRVELSKQADLEIQKNTLATQAETYESLEKTLIKQREQLDSDRGKSRTDLHNRIKDLKALGTELNRTAKASGFLQVGVNYAQLEKLVGAYQNAVNVFEEASTVKNQRAISEAYAALFYEVQTIKVGLSGNLDPKTLEIEAKTDFKTAKTLQTAANDFTKALNDITKTLAEQKRLEQAVGIIQQAEKDAGVQIKQVKGNLKDVSETLSKYGTDFGIEVGKTTQSLIQLDNAVKNTAALINGGIPPAAAPTPRAGTAPTSYNNSANFGGIYVTVQSSGGAVADGKAIAQALNNELRRGTVQLQTGRNA